jgi:hypothetical protein
MTPSYRLIRISGQSANSELPAQTREKGYRFEFLEMSISTQRLLSHLGLAPRKDRSTTIP